MSDVTKMYGEHVRIEEYKALREEITKTLAEQRSTERAILLSSAAVYASLVFTDKHISSSTAQLIAWCLPPIIALLGFARCREGNDIIAEIAAYLRQFEPSEWGWESHLVRARAARKLARAGMWYAVFWSLVIAGTGAIAAFQICNHVPTAPYIGITLAILTFMAATAGIIWTTRPTPTKS
jgi:hypothetical protein